MTTKRLLLSIENLRWMESYADSLRSKFADGEADEAERWAMELRQNIIAELRRV